MISNSTPIEARDIIYVTGRSFSVAHDGWSKRLQIVSEFLARNYQHHPRYLLAPEQPLTDKEMDDAGWQWIPVSSTASLRPIWWRSFWRLWLVFNWRYANRCGAEMLGLIGGRSLRLGARQRRFLGSRPKALVLVGRCEFAGMVNFRTADQRWALDSNDSSTNLESVYKYADRWRRLACVTRKAWLARLQRAEQSFARHYDRIISFSADDDRFFASVAPGKVHLEDTCIVLPSNVPARRAKFDVGLIGGSYVGSVQAAGNLIDLAAMPKTGRLRFGIAGKVCGELGNRSLTPNVELVGTVEDSLAFLRQCRCVVIFTGQETGTSVKFQESLAAGCIVIANKKAARFSLAKAGETHLEVTTMDEVAQLLLSGAVWRFTPRRLQVQFSRAAFHQRFAEALDWPSSPAAIPQSTQGALA